MTGGAESFLRNQPQKQRIDSCLTCGGSMHGKRSNALTCSDRCRKVRNGQTNGTT